MSPVYENTGKPSYGNSLTNYNVNLAVQNKFTYTLWMTFGKMTIFGSLTILSIHIYTVLE